MEWWNAGAGMQQCSWAAHAPVIYVPPRQERFPPLFTQLLSKREVNLQWFGLAQTVTCAVRNCRVVASVAAQGRLQPRRRDWPPTLFDTGRSGSSVSLIPKLTGLPKPCAGHSRSRTSSSLPSSRRSCGAFLTPAAPGSASPAVFSPWQGEI